MYLITRVGYPTCLLFLPYNFFTTAMPKRICLFDIDGTLTKSRNVLISLFKLIQNDMKNTLKELKKIIDIGFVGGSDAKKIREQLD